MARARAFYENVFGQPLQEVAGGRFYLFGADWQRYGVSGMIWHDEGADAAACGGCNAVFSAATTAKLRRKKAVVCGGKTVGRKNFPIANGFAAFVEDSEGNRIGLHSQR